MFSKISSLNHENYTKRWQMYEIFFTRNKSEHKLAKMQIWGRPRKMAEPKAKWTFQRWKIKDNIKADCKHYARDPSNLENVIKTCLENVINARKPFPESKRRLNWTFQRWKIKLFPKRTDSSSTGFNVQKLENTKMHLRTGGKVDC